MSDLYCRATPFFYSGGIIAEVVEKLPAEHRVVASCAHHHRSTATALACAERLRRKIEKLEQGRDLRENRKAG